MELSKKGLQLIKDFEGVNGKPVLEAYKDQAGIWTIGYGTIRYPNGDKVKSGDICTAEEAENYLLHDTDIFVDAVNEVIRPENLAQNKFDALVSLCYNIGTNGFANSTVVRLVKKDPSNPAIADAFMMWNKVTINGKKEVSNGLANRRRAEVGIYFGSI